MAVVALIAAYLAASSLARQIEEAGDTAQNEAEAANSRAEEASDRLDDLEGRVDVIESRLTYAY